jgi:hypothetical protein
MELANLYVRDDRIDSTINKIKKCWYCDSICFTFISICSNCIYQKRKKLLFKKNTYYNQNECK